MERCDCHSLSEEDIEEIVEEEVEKRLNRAVEEIYLYIEEENDRLN